jgi:hypothetical protein
MKSARSAISGIIIGIMLTVTATAAVQEYTLKKSECKLMVDGVEVKGELPLLIMDPGYNYIPAAEFRSICDKIGIGFEFDVPTKEVRIETRQAQIETKGVDTVSEPITQTPDGIPTFQHDGEDYIKWSKIAVKCESFGFPFDTKNSKFNIKNTDGTIAVSIPLYTIYSTQDSARYDDYVSIILPFLEG